MCLRNAVEDVLRRFISLAHLRISSSDRAVQDTDSASILSNNCIDILTLPESFLRYVSKSSSKAGTKFTGLDPRALHLCKKVTSSGFWILSSASGQAAKKSLRNVKGSSRVDAGISIDQDARSEVGNKPAVRCINPSPLVGNIHQINQTGQDFSIGHVL